MNYLKSKMNDDVIVNYIIWETNQPPKGIVVLVHGMAEHIGRYDEFAKELNGAGSIVYGYNQRGHGNTAGDLENLGFFASKNGWDIIVDDLSCIINMAKDHYPDLPVFLFGHSMGSFVVRDYASKHSTNISGLICSGTGSDSGFAGKVLLSLAKFMVLTRGAKSPGKLISKITNNKFNKNIKPLRTEFDWLSRDEKEVDKYIKDEYCGTVFSNKFYDDLFSAVIEVNKKEIINKMREDLPIYLISGEEDPIGDYGKGVQTVYNNMKFANEQVTLKLYPESRHEIINELNKSEVVSGIIAWIEARL